MSTVEELERIVDTTRATLQKAGAVRDESLEAYSAAYHAYCAARSALYDAKKGDDT